MPTTSLKELLSKMWSDYCLLNPAAKRIHELFQAEGEKVLNDHIALRTFNHPKLGIAGLARQFKAFGYVESPQDYVFTDKKLYAKHFEHPDQELPKIFISELELEKVSPYCRDTLNSLAEGLSTDVVNSENFSMVGRPWKMTTEAYNKLAQESEYASWVAAHGFRPNHFTVNVNALKKFGDLKVLNEFVKSKGYTLNTAGGEIKGTPAVYLEQSSTMASEVNVKFDDGELMIPGCYYEFAKRYPLPTGELYQGFVAASADKIFESTNKLK